MNLVQSIPVWCKETLTSSHEARLQRPFAAACCNLQVNQVRYQNHLHIKVEQMLPHRFHITVLAAAPDSINARSTRCIITLFCTAATKRCSFLQFIRRIQGVKSADDVYRPALPAYSASCDTTTKSSSSVLQLTNQHSCSATKTNEQECAVQDERAVGLALACATSVKAQRISVDAATGQKTGSNRKRQYSITMNVK